ncbi:hypothetical protein P7L78_02580 (plasmid) [Tistrella bauzanensis]|uniref:hypothetical protein n=1 Tax=Tistrella TaxID=171436 RepID=UPI0031F606E6
MSVASLYDAFVRATAQGTISATILPLMGKLTTALGVTALPLTDGDPVRLSAAARLTGKITWADGTSWTLTLVGTVDDDRRDVLEMSLLARTASGKVVLSTLVPDLPTSRIPSPDVGGTLMLGPSIIGDLGPEQAGVLVTAVDDGTADVPPVVLSGNLVLTGTKLAPYAAVLGATQLNLNGTIDPRADAAIADKVKLIAVSPTASTDWPKMGVEQVSLSLTTDYTDVYSLEEPPALISAVLLVLVLTVNTGRPHDVVVTVPLLQSDTLWDIDGNIDPPLTLSDGIIALLQLFPGTTPDTFSLPAGVAALDAFGLSNLRFGIETTGGDLPLPTGISYTGATIVSTTPWDLPIPFIRIEEVGASWLVLWGTPASRWSGSLFGTMRFGSKTGDGEVPPGQEVTDNSGDPVYLDVVVGLPDLTVEATTRGAIELDLAAAMSVFFPGTQPSVSASLIIDRITMGASLPAKTYGATLVAHGDWEIPIGDVTFTLDNVTFEVTVSPSKIWGGLAGMAGVYVGGEQMTILSAGAYYPGDGSWTFQGGLAVGTLNLTEFVYAFLGQTAPDWLPDLELTRLWASYSTSAGNPYAVSAAVAVRWDPDILGVKLALVAEADIKRRPKATGPTMQAARDVLRLDGLAINRPRLHSIVITDAAPGDAPVMIYEGAVKGSFELNNLIVTVGLSFLSDEMTWLFRLQLDKFTLEARTSWTGTGDKRHQVLTVEMQGVTLGAMIESFAALANPNANYRLESPWTFLNSINLGHFTLVIDPTEQSVTLNYTVNLKLGFITIKTVGIRYDRSTGEPQVNIEITGNFLGKDYGREPGMSPLGWDALNDSPPAVPGAGNSLIDLRYMGFGQHVTLDGLTRPDSLADIIELMRQQLTPMDDPFRNPLDQPSGNKLHFDENSQWLIGLDITLMGTVTVKLVMNDPNLYGVLIALAGPEAGGLSGFSFELLYKKVTDDIGVFHARLQVPDMFRQLDFGVVAITLGIITVDVFTNGNFKVDLGFPHARDFSVSFGLQYGPFLGKGGIYFGLLNGATSTRVPAITNGTFSPVLELGIGLAVGIGREFNKGPLKAGLYLQVEVVFEGVLAWFHPNDAAASKAMYFWAQGTAALVGKVYGKVDFKVISIDVSFEAYAAATLTMAAYKPTLINMSVGVRVKASIKIVFVKISFSFSTSLDVSFTIGSASTTPWVLSADQSGRNLNAASGAGGAALGRNAGLYDALGITPLGNASRSVGARYRRRPADMTRITRTLTRARLAAAHRAAGGAVRPDHQSLTDHHPLTAQMSMLADDNGITLAADPCADGSYRLNFSADAKVYPDGAIERLDVRLVPGFTIADLPVNWPSADPVTGDADPAYKVVLMLSIDGPQPVEVETLAMARTGAITATARAAEQQETSFAVLAEGLFRWAISAIGLDPQTATLTAGDLAELAAQMDCPQTFADGFSFTNLNGFLANNVDVRLSGIPAGDDPDVIGGVSFPMPPVLGWTSPDLPPPENDRNFANWQPVDNAYAARIATYFRKLSPQPMGTDGGDGGGGIDDNEPLSSVIFREYMLLITKSMVQAAENLFARFPVEIDETSTLAGIADGFPTITVPYVMHLGDTVDQVAATYGYGTAELLALNPGLAATLDTAVPGQILPIILGVTPESIAAANPERLLTAAKTIHAAALDTQILDGETAAALCARVGAVVDDWLATIAALDVPTITRAGAPLALPQASFSNPTALTLVQAAALFYVRVNAGTLAVAAVPEAAWYGEAIVQLTGDTIGADGSLPATVMLPSAYDTLTDPVRWTRLSGDTLPLLAAATALWQNPTADPLFATWLTSVQALNPGYTTGAVIIPAADTALQPDETLRALAARLLMVADPTAEPAVPGAGFRGLVAPADILAPLADVTVTNCTLTTADDQTLRDFATTYDLAIETVGRIGAEIAGLIRPVADKPLIVPTLAAVTLDTLMPALTADAPVRDVAGQVSRFMLHGQRLPVPGSDDDDTLGGLYDLVGQQVTGPAPDGEQPPETVRLTVTITETVDTPWLTLVATETAPADADMAMLTAGRADFAARNPAAAAGHLRPGMILEVDDADDLVITVTEKMLGDGYPSTSLTPVLYAPPTALQLWQDVPVRHGLPQMVMWQVAARPDLPALGAGNGAAAVGMPSFWPFTSNLASLAASVDSGPWQLYRADPEQGPDAPAIAMERFTWATLVDITINRVPGRPHTVEVIGADTAGRQLLLELWQYLEANAATDDASLFFGFQLSPAAGLAGGLVSPTIDRDATSLVRTNLSTETRSGNVSSARSLALADGDTPPSGPYFAPLSNALGFLTLLWEASVVGGGGYWLDMTDADGQGFSDEIWGPDGNAVFTIMAVLDSQSGASPARRLHSFNTAALVADPVDTSATALFVAAPDDRDQVRRATVAQGNVGFTMGLTNPPDTGDSPELTARRLYNLAGYHLVDTAVFEASNDGQPVNGQVDDGTAPIDALRMQKRVRAEDATDDNQTVAQIIPIHRYAKSASVPTIPGLPPAAGDPYAGISAPGRTAPPTATVTLGFHDIFGNSTSPAATQDVEPTAEGDA